MAINVNPGNVQPYSLPPQDVVEEPYDRISFFAITESGENESTPLNTIQLKNLLRNLDKRHRRTKRTSDVAQRYTEDINGVISQLLYLRQRISEIELNEEYMVVFFKERIKEIIKAVDKGKRVSPMVALPVPYSVDNALTEVGSGEGSLNKDQLLSIIYSGNCVMETADQSSNLMDQLDDILISIKNEEKNRKLHCDFISEQIRRATKNITKELLYF